MLELFKDRNKSIAAAICLFMSLVMLAVGIILIAGNASSGDVKKILIGCFLAFFFEAPFIFYAPILWGIGKLNGKSDSDNLSNDKENDVK